MGFIDKENMMAIETADIETIINNLSNSLLEKLTALQQDTQMEDEHFATTVSSAIVSSVEGGIKLAGLAKQNALIDKDIALKSQQIAESVARVTRENSQSSKELLVMDKDIALKSQQIAESVARVTNAGSESTAKVILTNRQVIALDDAKKVKKAELLGNTVSLIESGGSTAPAKSWTDFNSAVAAI